MNRVEREARDSQVGQLRTKGKGIKEIMALTGQSYARVHETLLTGGLIREAAISEDGSERGSA